MKYQQGVTGSVIACRQAGALVEQPLILDRYRPLEDLATGGYGEVVLAFDSRMHRRVAIKRLPIGGKTDRRRVTPNGLEEARTAALLSHPNIVTVHEWDTDADEAFIIMEFVDGISLADLLDEEGALDLDEAAAVVEGVSAALEHAHENGVLHLDVKPENVLITRDGRVKVTDFGVAELSAAAGHGPAVGGTLGFMPLEQLRAREVDERTDVWAFGALAYEVLANANPFSSDTLEGAIFKAEIVDAAPPSDFEGDLSAAVDDIVLAALSTHAVDRYASIREFSYRLLDHLGDPAAGRDSLASLVARHVSEESEADAIRSAGLGLWDRLGSWSSAPGRLAAGLSAGWLTWAGIAPIASGTWAPLGAAGLAGLAAVIAPGLGTGIALLALGAGMLAAGWWLAAVIYLPLAATAWWFAGRQNFGLVPALGAAPLGTIRLGPASPLISGFAQPWRQAAINGAVGGALLMLASAASGGEAPYLDVSWSWISDPLGTRVVVNGMKGLFTDPAPLAVLVGWTAAATIMSIACRRASRTAAVLGAALGGAALWAGYALADVIATSRDASVTWSGELLLSHLMASLILIVLVIAAGPPVRAEEE